MTRAANCSLRAVLVIERFFVAEAWILEGRRRKEVEATHEEELAALFCVLHALQGMYKGNSGQE